MSGYALSSEALTDIFNSYDYIAQDNYKAAEEVETRLFETFESLARFPGQGHQRSDLTSKPLLFFPVYSYLIVYRPQTDPLQIFAVLHGARNVKRILKMR